MHKLILLIKRKPGTTKEQFREHYENTHAPLAKKVMPKLAAYKRTFLQPLFETENGGESFDLSQSTAALDYDVCTEFFWKTEEDMQEAFEFMRSPAGQVLVEDEMRFMDRDSMSFYLGTEAVTDFS